MPAIDVSGLTDFATRLVAAAGASEEEAAVVAESLVLSNLCGYDSHGVMRIPFYADMIAKQEAVPGAELSILNEGPSLIAADANWGL